MNLLNESIGRFCLGVEDIEITNGVARFHRIPHGLRPFYGQAEGSMIRMSCPAGVRLRFRSDTTTLHISMRYGASARKNFRGTILVDNEPSAWGPPDTHPEWDGDLFAGKTRAMRTFDIWLPHMCVAELAGLEIDDDCTVQEASPPSIRWLAYGDSITQGMTSTLPTTTHFGKLALDLDAEVHNLGIGGARLVRDLSLNLPAGKFDVISIAYGTNDFNRGVPVEEYRKNAELLLDALSEAMPETPVILASVLTWAGRTEPNSLGLNIDDYRTALHGVEKDRPTVTIVDGGALIPDDPSFFVDNIHPNDRGFTEYAGNLRPAFRR